MTPGWKESVEEHRDELEELAESDLPAAWIAETLLKADSPEVKP